MQEKGIVVLSFDDGREDLVYNIVPLLVDYGIPATFNITTGYIDGTIREENKFCENRAAMLSDLIKISNNNLFEFAAHGDQHLNTYEDICTSLQKLREWGLVNERYGFASPCHGMDSLKARGINEIIQRLGLSYIRIGTQLNRSLFARIDRRLSLITNNKSRFKSIYSKCLNNPSVRIFKCIPYNKRINNNMLFEMIQEAEKTKTVLVLLFHSVLKINEQMYQNVENIDYSQFKKLCDYLSREREVEKIHITTNIQAVIEIDDRF